MRAVLTRLFLVGLLVLVLAGTTAAAELIVAKDQEAVGFDPHKVPAASSIQIYQQLFNSLLTTDRDGNIIGDIAHDWDVEDDQIYTFYLRDNVVFHNGRPMTAADVKYSFERILDPETASIATSYYNKIEAMEVVDDYTIRFFLEEVFAGFLDNIAHVWGAIVPQEVVEEHGDLNQHPVGTGPFMLDTWNPDNYTVLVRNPDYFETGLPKVDSIRYLIMRDEAAKMAALRAGNVHISSITAEAAFMLDGLPNLGILSYPSRDYTYMGFNMNEAPFDDPKVRLAVSYAVDREQLADIVYSGFADVTGPVAPGQGWWALDTSEYPSYTRDVEKAKELQAEAGYPDGVEFIIKTASTYPYMVDTAVTLQHQLGQAGFRTSIELVEWGAYIDAWSNTNHQVLVGLNGSGVTPDRALHFFFHSSGTANVWGMDNPDFDALVEQARLTTDLEARHALYADAQRLLVNEVSPNLFLNSPYSFFAVQDTVQDFNPTASTSERLFKQVSLTQ